MVTKVDVSRIYSDEELKMITKEDLLNELKEALKTEENIVPLYTEHVSSTLFLSPFEKPKQERIQQILNTLKLGSQEHARKYEQLILKVRKGNKDVY